MRDSSIKTSIDKAIGEEAWLTEDVVRKMARKQSDPTHQKWSQRLIPSIAILSLIVGAFFLFMTQPNSLLQTSASPNWRQIERAIEDEQVEAAFMSYLKASVDQDYAKFEKVSSTIVVASPKEVFETYEQIDWSTYRVVAVHKSKGEPVTTLQAAFQMKGEDEEVIQMYDVTFYDDKTTVSEALYEKLPEYTPFAFPEKLELSYIAVPEAQRVEREFSEEEILYTYEMQEGESDVVVHKVQDGEYEFYARRSGETFYLTTIYGKQALGASWGNFLPQQNGDAGYYLEIEGLGLIGLIFFGETIGFLETPKDYQLERRFLSGEEDAFVMITGDSLQVVRYGEKGFEGAGIHLPAINKLYPSHPYTYQLGERANHFQVISGYLEGEKKAIYDFEDLDTLIKRD